MSVVAILEVKHEKAGIFFPTAIFDIRFLVLKIV